jgi:acyl-CoA thioesterase I
VQRLHGLLIGLLCACASPSNPDTEAVPSGGGSGGSAAGTTSAGGSTQGTPGGSAGTGGAAPESGGTGAGAGAQGGTSTAGGNGGDAASGGSDSGSGGATECPLPPKGSEPLAVACVGDSITQGTGAPYPEQLGELLGEDFDVKNFGHSGASLVNGSYAGTAEYSAALAFEPDVVVIMLGTNDMNTWNLSSIDDFVGDYLDMIATFRALPSTPVVYLGLPPWVKEDDTNGGYTEERLTTEILPRIEQVSEASGACLIDLHAVTLDHPEYYADNLHPNDLGYGAIAQAIAAAFE